MKSTILKNKVQDLLPEQCLRVVRALIDYKARPLLVGGAVRDVFLEIPIKDIDIEVHGISLENLEKLLKTFGRVQLVGKSFGVLRLSSLDIDWSLPRTDSKGRKPKVSIDPFMSIKEAFRRRDLTINAMGIDLKTFELVDPFHGFDDLKKKLLRATDVKLFTEDPLRFYRVMQFVGRFAMKSDASLNEICRTMNVSSVAVERIEQECNKLLLRSSQPSLGFRWLKQIDRLRDIFPELHALIGVEQSKQYHPEGDVFEHTMQVIDAAAALAYKDNDEKLLMMYAALCHDLGKVVATQKEDGKIRTIGHDKKGVSIAVDLLRRMTKNKTLIKTVKKLVLYHMRPVQLIKGRAKTAAYKRLANLLSPDVTMHQLALLFLSDTRGRNSKKGKPLTTKIKEHDQFLRNVQNAGVEHKSEEPILTGRDLMGKVQPGPKMGRLLKKAYEIQITEGITDKRVLKKRILPA